MEREEVMDTFKVYLERQIYGKGLIPLNKAVILSDGKWEPFKLQFEEDKLQIITSKVKNIKYEDIRGILFNSHESDGSIHVILRNKPSLKIESPLRTQLYHFSSTSSVMKYRWGHLDMGSFLYCKGEEAVGCEPFTVFTRKPFDFNLDGDCVVLNDDERWLGYLINKENAHVYTSIKGRPNSVTRSLEIEGFVKKEVIVKECITYYFKAKTYKYTSYYSIRTMEF